MSFWNELKRPIFVLAPMADVTDAAFRRIITKYGKPDVMWTEFVSCDGLALAPEEGRQKLLRDLEYTEEERPIVAQLFTDVPEYMEKGAALVQELGFDGVDINMGCPVKTIDKQGAGAALIKEPKLAQEIVHAAKQGAPKIPVSVKTRIGYNQDETETWIPNLLETDIAVLTIHARTKKDMSKVPAKWDCIKRAVEIRNELAPQTLLLGNGDALDIGDARKKVEKTGCDGVMLGRAIFGNPWLFAEKVPTIEEKLKVMVEHTKLFEELLGDAKNFAIMKKHYKAYVNGFDGAKELRMKLMETDTAEEVETITNEYLSSL